MPATDAYRDWAASVVKRGGTVTTMPKQAGARVGAPAARYSAAQIAKFNASPATFIGQPTLWTAGNQNGFYLASDAVAKSQAAILNEASDVPSKGLLDGLLGAESPLADLGAKLRSLGTVAYWLVIVGAVIGVGILLHNVSKKHSAV